MVLLAYGFIFTVGAVLNWKWLVGSGPPGRLPFRLFLFLTGCLLLLVGSSILIGG
jgi:hypothetical protein